MKTSDTKLARLEAALDALRRAKLGAHERLNEGLQLTRTQVEILSILAHGRHTTGELAQRLFLTQSAVTQTIDTLARRDLVERHPDEHDRRVVRLELSPSGRGLTDQLQQLRRVHLERLAEQLTSAEIDALISFAAKLSISLETSQPLKPTPKGSH